jgi:hypothetical protein
MNKSHQALIASNFVLLIPKIMAISPTFNCNVWCVIDNPFEHISLTKHSTASSTCEYFPFLHPKKYFVVVLQQIMEFQLFFQG